MLRSSASTIPSHPIQARHGFTLVELSIVMVVLALLVGSILGGQSLIHAAELRSVSSEYDQWQVALNTFYQRYNALPGDFPRATEYWSDTGNGNGNGLLSPDSTPAEDPELFLFWQHLELANLISGKYTGEQGPASTFHIVPGVNAPKSGYGNNAGWSTATRYGGSAARYEYNYVNTFLIGKATANSYPQDPLFPPEDAWNIDKKSDDGLPGQGNVLALYWQTCAKSTSKTDYDKGYALEKTTPQCGLYFLTHIQ